MTRPTLNPKLRHMYVGYAMVLLEVLHTAIDELNEHSRVDSSIVSGVLQEEKRRLVAGDDVYQEAAWRLSAHIPLPSEEEYCAEKK